MAGRREYEMLFQLNAQLGSNYSSTFTKAQAQISSMQKEMQSLSKTQGDIAAYQKQQKAVDATRSKLENLQGQYALIGKEIENTTGDTSALEREKLKLQQRIIDTTASLETSNSKVERLGEALHEAGIDTENLSDESKRLATEFSDLKAKQQEVVDTLDQGGKSAKFFSDETVSAVESIQQTLAAAGIVKLFQEIGEAMVACAQESIEFESAITGVYKTVDGTDEELAAISDEIKELSTNIPATTTEIAAVAESAGQLGIATSDVMDFTEVMINLGEATNLSAEEAASSLAKFSNITGTAASDYSRLGSVIVDLGNNYATTEADIVAMATRLASAGTLAGLTEPEILALSAAMSSVGIEAEAGGTAMTQTLSAIETAVANGGDSLNEFARIAGMTAEDFSTAWATSPAVALQSFIAGLGSLEDQGESATLVLDELGLSGVRQSNMLKSLGLAADTLTGAVSTANTAWGENVALAEEASKRYATTESQQAMLINAFNNLKIAVGDNYTPALRELYSVGTDVTVAFTEFVEQNPALVRAVTAAVGVVGLATAGLAAYTVGAKLAAAASKLFAGSIPGLNVILGVTAGVAALAAGVAALTAIEDSEAQQLRELTEASREDYAQLQETKAAYEQACSVYGETSQEAQYLAWRVDDLTEAYETNKQTLTEYIEGVQAANESATSLMDANREAYNEIGTNEGTTLALVHRLQELASQTDQTVETQEEMKAIIAELNGIVPELALSYEDVVGGVTDYAAAIESTVKAQAAAQRYEQAQQGMVDAYNEQISAQERLKELTDQQTAARERYNTALQEYNEYSEMVMQSDTIGMSAISVMLSDEYKELVAAEEAYKSYTDQVEETQGVLDQATTEYQDYLDSMVDYVEETTDAADTTAQLNERINETISEMEALSEAYTLAYDAAYESVTGQYSLWDEAAEVVATSAGTINSAIDSQITYWQNYNTNLQALNERTKDIKGLSDMIASFADGSTDSVNAVAGMATATDEELAGMVADWQTLQAEQDNVAASIAELKTNFTSEMDSLQSELAADIEAMDLGSEAAASGRNTIQGFINGANAMLPQVQAAYARIAQAATAALGSVSVSGIGTRGYATGTVSAERGFAMVGENGPELVFFQGGEQVLTATETAALQTRVQATSLGVEAYETNATEASYGGSVGSSVVVNVNINVEGNATEQTVEALNEYSDEFAERVLAVVEEAGIDASRRSY